VTIFEREKGLNRYSKWKPGAYFRFGPAVQK